MSTFTWTPDIGFSVSSKPTVTVAQFGDGYSQRIRDGINTLGQELSLEFKNRSLNDIANIRTFLESMAGAEAFEFTAPGTSTAKQYICSEWSETYESVSAGSITCTFVRVYD